MRSNSSGCEGNLLGLAMVMPRAPGYFSIHMTELAQLAFVLMLWGIVDTMSCALRK
jgi:hypothetical protein